MNRFNALFLIGLFGLSSGCANTVFNSEASYGGNETIESSIPSLTYDAATGSVMRDDCVTNIKTALIDYHWLDAFNQRFDTRLALTIEEDEGLIGLQDESMDIQIEYDGRTNIMVAQITQLIHYIKADEERSGTMMAKVDINTTSGFDLISGQFITEDNAIYPFEFDYFLYRIIDGDKASKTYGNVIRFTADLYEQMLNTLYYFATMSSSFHYMISQMIISLGPNLREPSIQECDRLFMGWDEGVVHYLDSKAKVEQRFFIASDDETKWKNGSELSQLDRSIMIASFVHQSIDDFSTIELEQFLPVVSSYGSDYSCEVDQCFEHGDYDVSADYISSLDLDGYHALVRCSTLDRLFADLFGIQWDSRQDIDRVYARCDYDLIIDGFMVYVADGDGVHGNHGVYVVDQAMVDGSGYVDYIPLALNFWDNYYFDVNGIRIDTEPNVLYPLMDGFGDDVIETIAKYPDSFPTYRVYLQCRASRDSCLIQSIDCLEE